MRKIRSGVSAIPGNNLSLKMTGKRSRTMSFFFAFFTLLVFGALFPAFAPLPALSSSFSSSPSLLQDSHSVKARKFDICDDMFWKDGQPFQIIGGDLHYFRVLPEYWKDRLLRAKALGLNTIQTYVPWNLHEPSPGEYVFEGIADVESFLKLCQELGFLVMLRSGPYICAEWDLGGFPAWLLSIEPAVKLRSSDPTFLKLVEAWWDILLPKISPLLYCNGGPIIMIQIENEYGSYGDDQRYLCHLVTLARRHLGNNTILYTTDGGSRETLEKGTIRGADVFSAVDFSTGSDPWSIFQLQKEFNAPGRSPPLSSEFYTGWLTHWGEKLAETDANFTANALEAILSKNGSAVLYMAHGGTNFGFFSGANTGGSSSNYMPDLTSYDYDAPIKETGDVDNLKFKALRSVIRQYTTVALPPIPSNNEKSGYGTIKVQKHASLFDKIANVDMVESETPIPMELMGQMFGFLLYLSEYAAKENGNILRIHKVHDRAQVFVSCQSTDDRIPTYVGTIERWSNRALDIPYVECVSNISLFILVENMGRVNYGPYMYDRKGILSAVYLDGNVLHGWKMFPLPFDNLNKMLEVNPIMQVGDSRIAKASVHMNVKDQTKAISKGPGFYVGEFFIDTLSDVKDTFISFRGWGKGFAFVNNINIGRFWPLAGPQCNLYVPAPVLQQGENVLVILEIEAPNPELVVNSVDKPDFTCS
ncbi:PREDICTED: beta-galactosidase 17 [Nelumbo nucifera]|uniref:Beta-galactosidase n=2 Tax=Nelumbo nucifera TaxID=4432 RepID=A0A1U8AIV6_NELNU|nr:PREDICTED: beta-galactosidase 17 [Nelumbo nucifera]DAD44404.1 TPA_asm: hypothetical protein HUJ06_002634 [Nelumbo nucifera]